MKEDTVKEINAVLRAYNYLTEEDEDMKEEELPSLVSHMLLLKIFSQESVKYNIPYEQVDEFCNYAIDYLYEKDEKGENVGSIDIEDIVDAFRAKGVKH